MIEITRQTYADLLDTGHSVDFKRLSLSPYVRMGRTWYQTHSDDYRRPFSQLYREIEDAIDSFIKLKRDMYGNRRNNG